MNKNKTNGKEEIIRIFRQKIKGMKPDVSGKNKRHDGKYGHWLESQFGIKANADNEADLYGYELKNQTTSKTTFGDWSANYYIFNDYLYKMIFNADTSLENRNIFLMIFGKKNSSIEGRYSWSGEPVPNIQGYNRFGQKLKIENENNNIVAIYSYSEDLREDKDLIVPEVLRQDNLILAKWYGNSLPSEQKFSNREKCLKEKVESKFYQQGWFTCKLDEEGRYYEVCFGVPLNFENWIDMVRTGVVFFDSGMYNQNKRPYSQWRANNKLWDSLIVDCYK